MVGIVVHVILWLFVNGAMPKFIRGWIDWDARRRAWVNFDVVPVWQRPPVDRPTQAKHEKTERLWKRLTPFEQARKVGLK